MTTLHQLRETLESAGEAHHVLPLDDGMSVVLTRRGARVLGLFPGAGADNLFWTNAALTSAERLQAFVAAGNWNLGGERCWIAPEIQYNVRDRRDFWGTLNVPAAVDPGDYRFEVAGSAVRFSQTITLEAFNTARGVAELEITRTIHPISNPLAPLQDSFSLMDGVRYGGYAQETTLTNLGDESICSEIWNLIQLNAGGQMIILSTPDVEASDYCGEVPPEARVVADNHVRLHMTGASQYKVGYKAATLLGRLAYWNRLADSQEYLFVRQFNNDASNVYAEEPPDLPGVQGHSVHVYNDGGEFGGDVRFGELECSGRTVGGQSGRSTAQDTFSLWAYVGSHAQISRIARVLLGVTL